MNMFDKVSSYQKKVESLLALFNRAIDKLRQTAAEAACTKAEKQDKIKDLQIECANLDSVVNRANTLAEKLENLVK